MSFTAIFDNFVHQYVQASTAQNKGLVTEYFDEFESPCIQASNATAGDAITWQPIKRDVSASMQNVAEALELDIHPDIAELFGRYYSLDLCAQTAQGPLTLLQAISEQDYQRLQKNLIAHVLMKRRLKQQETLFFALTDKDDLLLSVLPQSAEVVLEVVGKPHHESIAKDLSSFFENLEAVPTEVILA